MIIITGACLIWVKSRSLPSLIRQAIVSELSHSLDTAVFIGDVRLKGPFSVRLENVAIAGRGQESGAEPFLRSDAVDVSINPLGYFLSGGKSIDIVRGIHIRQPQIRLSRLSEGIWNVPLPASSSESGGTWPDMEITLSGGRMTADTGGASFLPGRTVFDLDSGLMSLNNKGMSFNLNTAIAGNAGSRTVLNGNYGKNGGRLELRFEELQSDMWRRALSKFTSVSMASGSIDGRLAAVYGPGGWKLNDGLINLSGGRIIPYKGAPEIGLRQVQFRLDDKNVYLPRTMLQWSGETAYVSGRIEDYNRARKLNLKIDADKANLARLTTAVTHGALSSVSGQGTVGIEISGSLAVPRIFGSIQSDDVGYGKERLQGVQAEFSYLNGGRYLLAGTARCREARVSGRLTGKGGRFIYSGRVDNFEAGRIPGLAKAGLGDIGRIDLDFQGRSGPAEYILGGKFSSGSGSIKGFNYKSAVGRFTSDGTSISLHDLKFGTELGTLEAMAVIRNGHFDISLHGSDLRPGRALPQLKGVRTGIKADISGPSSKGSVNMTAQFAFNGGRYGAWDLAGKRVEVAGAVSGDTIDLSRIALAGDGADIVAAGNWNRQSGNISLLADLNSVPLSVLAQAAGAAVAFPGGNLTGWAAISGNTASPRTAVEVSGKNLDFNGEHADLDLSMVLEDGRVAISRGRIGGEAGNLNVAGTLGGILGSVLNVEGIGITSNLIASLSGVREIPSGRYDLKAALSGTTSQPVLRAVVSGDELSYRGVPVDNLKADLTYSQGQLRIPSLIVNQAAGLLTAAGINVPVAVENGRISFDGPVAGKINASLVDLTALGWERLTDFSGPLKLAGSLSGSIKNPVLSGNIDLAEGHLNLQGLDISALAGSFVAGRERIDVADLKGVIGQSGGDAAAQAQPVGNIAGGGSITLRDWQLDRVNGRLALVDGRLESIAGLSAPYFKSVSGTFAGEVRIDGQVSSPDIVGDIRLVDAGGYFGPLKSPLAGVGGQVRLSSGRLEIVRLAGYMDKGTVDISGDVKLEGIKPVSLNLALASDNARINYPPYFNGLVDSQLIIAGPVGEPLIEGSVGISNSRVTLASLSGAGKSFFRPELNIKGTMGRGVEVILSKISAPVKGTLDISGTLGAPNLQPRNLVADFGLFKIPITSIPI